MFLNYLKIAFRSLLKRRLYSFINIGGLGVGLACAVLIALWVQDELSYDRFQKNLDSIYRVNWDFKFQDGNSGVGPGTPPPLAAMLLNNVSGVDEVIRLRSMPNATIRSGNTFFDEKGVLAVDSNFFNFFSFQLVKGDPSTVLRHPNSVVLTQDLAARLFGDESPIGKTLFIDKPRHDIFGTYQNLFRVTGVVRNPPRNSHIQFSMLTSISSYPEVAFFNWSWVWMQVTTYARLREGTSSAAINTMMPSLVRKHGAGGFRRLGTTYDEIVRDGGRFTFTLQPLRDVYLGSVLIGNRLGPLGDRSQVSLMLIIAMLVLGIACVNFMNLATAQSATRAREIGIRKVLGSQRRMLLGQFLVESMLFSFLALPVALLLVEAALPSFSALAGKHIVFNPLAPLWLPVALVGLTACVGLLSGSYPALYLSSLLPAPVVKKGAASARRGGLRNVLVTVQFAASIVLISCTLLVRDQMDYVGTTNLGFDRRGIVVISNQNGRLGGKAAAFRDALLNHPQIVDATITTGVPPNSMFGDNYKVEGKGDMTFSLVSYLTDEHFLSTMRIPIDRGRGFSKDFAESSSVVLNEAAVRTFGLSDPVGKTIRYPGGHNETYTIIGVMGDFNFQSLYSPMIPFAIFHSSSHSYVIPDSFVLVRIRQDAIAEALSVIKKEWGEFAPSMPLNYDFLDQQLAVDYQSARRLGSVFMLFSVLAVVVACIGLFGLAAFTAERKTKEVGIRKVLGASVSDMVTMLSREFMILVLVANVIAWPVAWYVMKNWLESFAYRIDIVWTVFAIAGGLALAIALLTVSYQAIRAALTNPVEALRYE